MREFLRFKKRSKYSQGIKATVQEQNCLPSFHQSIGVTVDKF